MLRLCKRQAAILTQFTWTDLCVSMPSGYMVNPVLLCLLYVIYNPPSSVGLEADYPEKTFRNLYIWAVTVFPCNFPLAGCKLFLSM